MPIRDNVAIEADVTIGDNLDTGYGVVLREGCVIGDQVKIWSNAVIDARARIGDRARIHCNCYIAQGCIVGNDVFIGPGTQLLNDKYPVRTDPKWWEPVVVGDGAIIGGGVTILPGVRIGERAVIGAGAVVTKSVPEEQVWWGNPARLQYFISPGNAPDDDRPSSNWNWVYANWEMGQE